MKYSEERREAILRKLLPTENRPLPEVAVAEGISAPTLCAWRKQARAKGWLLPDHCRDPEGWTSRDKFSAVVETAAMNAIELAEFCRQRNLYPDQIQCWRRSREQDNARADDTEVLVGQELRPAGLVHGLAEEAPGDFVDHPLARSGDPEDSLFRVIAFW